jgi:hypothetical protein
MPPWTCQTGNCSKKVSTEQSVINPIQYRIENHREIAPLSHYILGTPVSLLILLEVWYFNRKAQKLKRDERDSKHEQKPSV